jgi:hypothetical protein
MLDPYYDWLSISKNDRPITCYALLGVSPKETDRAAIEQAAAVQSELVSQYSDGPHAPIAERILKEIEKAKSVLLDPAKRKAYDDRLNQSTAKKPVAPKREDDIVPVEEVADDDIVDLPETQPAPKAKSKQSEPVRKDSKPARKRPAKESSDDENDESDQSSSDRKDGKKKSTAPFILAGVIAAVAILLGGTAGAYFLFFKKAEEPTTAFASHPITRRTLDTRPADPQPAPKTVSNTKPATPAPTKAAEKPPQPQPQPTKPPEPAKPPQPAAPAVPVAAKIVKIPVPPDSELARAEKSLKETFKAEYAKPKLEDKVALALAVKFLLPDREDRKDPAAWFVPLREARDLAVQTGKPRLALAAIDEMDKWFVIDAVEMRVKAMTDIAGAGNNTVVASVYRQAMNLIQQAYDKDDYTAARRYAGVVEKTVRDKNLTELLDIVRTQKGEVETYAREYDQFVQARAKLAKSPDDPEANLIVGKHLCYFLADWSQGLPMLAKCSDASLKEHVRKDLSNPPEVAGQLAVADGWWTRIEPLREREQRMVRKRARFWYERAGALATDADRSRVINRIMESQRIEYSHFKRLFPGSFFGRGPEDRILLLREGGGNVKSEEAVERGLDWLAKHISSTGIWTTDLFQKAGKCSCRDQGEKHDVAGTGLAIMAFAGAGQTHVNGKHAGAVRRALNYLLAQQIEKKNGNFHDNAYENALATTAVVELYGLSRDRALKIPAQAAVNYIVLAQNRNGGWGYTPQTEKPDMSVCGWQFTALKAAAFAGLSIPKETFGRLSGFLDTVADPNGLGYGYNSPGAAPSTSAVGLLCREFLDWGPGHPGLIKAIDFLLRPENYPTKEKTSLYSVFYITQVAHHYGGERWEKWNSAVRNLLIDLQDKGDDPKYAHQKGSWGPMGDAWAKQGGRMVYTCLALITLETYYYHIPLYGYGPYTLLD